MTETHYISLEQWRALVTVVDTGGYAQAAEALHKSQSSVTYAVKKIETQLDVQAFVMQGRKAVLTPTGQLLYRRAKVLLEDSNALERAAKRMSAGWEAEIRLAVEILFPTWLLLDCLNQFGAESPQTRIELIESVLGGTTEALVTGQVDLAIAGRIPQGFLGSPLARLRIIAVAHPAHPLHQLGRELTLQDLRGHRQLVVRETGSSRNTNILSVDATQRWTVSNSATSIGALSRGYGFAWLPADKIPNELEQGILKPLPLRDGGERWAQLYLIMADPDAAGPGTRRLSEILLAATHKNCPRI